MEQPTQLATSRPKSCALPEAWIERLFARFEAMYGARFADAWKGCNLANVKAVWAETLGALTRDELATGVAACQKKPFPPTLPEFITLCRPPIDFEDAFLFAVRQMARRDRGDDEWPVPAVFWAAVQIGSFDLRNSSWATIEKRWRRVLQAEIDKGEWQPIPPRSVALPAPGGTSPRPEVVSVIAERVAGDMTMGGRLDLLVWAKRPRSGLAWRAVLDGAKQHEGLRECVEQAIESGIATREGELLRRWDGFERVVCDGDHHLNRPRFAAA